ncbi:MAG: 3,4-dihydroxy-2-butanone-4-phosphate synthase [Bacteriovoracaceae bacterium]|jgi:3,4-dihydroxy 2-butanone 4-phosphate synthase/GTP cyclohydrolase II|nr:3,4-dihydroxy-2-butanone-4-phosphate synthase [Bacteriovoracaceae bacterium]
MLDSIQGAIEDIKNGKMVIVIDDENRENEGDFIMAASKVTADDITFMATYGKGLICSPVSTQIANTLDLGLMVQNIEDSHGTAFTVSIDAKEGISTGISSADRARTIELLTNPNSKKSDFVSPGHMFPLIAKDGGVTTRPGHTEAAVDLAVMAGLPAAGVICEILNEDGTCARVDDLRVVAKKFNLKLISIEDLIKYKKEQE